MLRFFVIQWLLDYLNTPQLERTIAIETLGIIAIGIIAFAALAACMCIYALYKFMKGRLSK